MRVPAIIGCGLAALALAGCDGGSGGRLTPTDLTVESCIKDSGAPGTYGVSLDQLDKGGRPIVHAREGGTLRGEVLISECLAQRLPAGATTKAKGPVKPVAVAGKLPLPTQYALMPGDADLWNTLTLAQQQRALLFLQDGSTIAASLRTD